MTQPVGRAALEIVAEADPRKLARQIERDANRALRQVDLDTTPISDQIQHGVNNAADSFDDLTDKADDAFLKVREGATRAGDGIGDEIEQGARRASDAIDGFWVDASGRLRDLNGRFAKLGETIEDSLGAKGVKASRDLAASLSGIGSTFAGAGKGLGVFALAATGVVALTGAVNALVAAVVALGPAILAGLATLPGIIVGAIAAISVFKAATAGFADALKAADDPAKFAEALEKLSPAAREAAVAVRDLTTSLKPVQQAIQQAFFTGVAPLIRDLSAAVAGLRNEAVGVASALGGIVQALLATAGSAQVVAPVAEVMRGLQIGRAHV